MDGERYREMRAIRAHIMAGRLGDVAAEIRSMKRLWPDMRGLQIRREKEAALWERGIATASDIPTGATTPKPKTSEKPAPLSPSPSPGGPEAGASGGGAVATGTAANEAAKAGLDPWVIAAIVAVGIVVTIAGVFVIRWRRSQPVMAREKG
jgi:hypothetical protein